MTANKLGSAPEELLAWQIKVSDLPEPTREHVFHKTRKWRFDFAWVGDKLAVEVEGGMWVRGRHTRGEGFTKDCEKYNVANLMGWRVLRFTPAMVECGEALDFIKQALNVEVE